MEYQDDRNGPCHKAENEYKEVSQPRRNNWDLFMQILPHQKKVDACSVPEGLEIEFVKLMCTNIICVLCPRIVQDALFISTGSFILMVRKFLLITLKIWFLVTS